MCHTHDLDPSWYEATTAPTTTEGPGAPRRQTGGTWAQQVGRAGQGEWTAVRQAGGGRCVTWWNRRGLRRGRKGNRFCVLHRLCGDSLQATRLHPQQPSGGGNGAWQDRQGAQGGSRFRGTHGAETGLNPCVAEPNTSAFPTSPGCLPGQRQQVYFQDISSVWPVHGDREGRGTGQRGLEEDDRERSEGPQKGSATGCF